MAKIPAGENFGQVTAKPANFSENTLPAASFGAAAADSVAQVGAQMVYEDRRQAAIDKATSEAADRAKAAAKMRDIEAGLATIGDDVAEGIKNGQIDKTKAADEFKRLTQEHITAGMADVPVAHQSMVQEAANTYATRLSRGVNKAVTQRDQFDVRAGLQSQLEYAQRLYLKDPAGADKMVAETIDALGPYSGMNPADLQKAQQSWREGTRLNKAQTLVNAARRDNKALDSVVQTLDSPEFADMDPGRKTTLLGQIEGFKVSNIQRQEADARRAEALQERRLRKAESSFNAAQSIITQGKVLSPEYIQQVTTDVEGTPYAAAIRETLKQAPERSSFGAQPLAVQRDTLAAARAKLNATGTNPVAEKRVAELEKVYQASVKDYKEDPLLAAQDRGVIPSIEPINTQSIVGMVQTIGKRMDQASLVQTQTGSPVSPLLSHEAEQVGKMINVLPVDQRATAIAQLAEVMGPGAASAFGHQVAPKDKALGLAIGLATAKTTAGRYTSELVLRGAQAMKDKAVTVDNKALTGIRAQVAAEIGDAYINQDVRGAMIDAAVFAEYGLQSEGSGDPRRAVSLVTGGITEHAGKKVPLPYGIKADAFEKQLQSLTPADIKTDKVVVGNTTMTADEFLRHVPSTPLIYAGQGRYAVQAGGGLALKPNGKPLILELSNAR